MEIFLVIVIIAFFIGIFSNGSNSEKNSDSSTNSTVVEVKLGLSFFENSEPIKYYNLQAIDFVDHPDNSEALCQHIRQQLEDRITCPSCGGRRIDGDGIHIKYNRAELFRDEEKRGFWGKYTETSHFKTVFVYDNAYFRASGVFERGGYIRCKSCGWEVCSDGNETTWYSIRDIFDG